MRNTQKTKKYGIKQDCIITDLEKIAKTRNEIAHGIVCRKYEPKWTDKIKELLNNISILVNQNVNLNSNPYDKAQDILLEKLEVIYK